MGTLRDGHVSNPGRGAISRVQLRVSLPRIKVACYNTIRPAVMAVAAGPGKMVDSRGLGQSVLGARLSLFHRQGHSVSSELPLLAFEIGNSRIKYGIFQNWKTLGDGQLPVCDELLTSEAETQSFPWRRLTEIFGGRAPVSIVSSVNPPALDRMLRAFPETGWTPPLVIQNGSQLSILNRCSPPERTGVDRLLKGVAGNVLRPAGKPLVLVDSGTATTVDWINAAGEFCGGAILPGLSLASRALHEHTAQLPLIPSESFGTAPRYSVGANTHDALCSGLYWGQVGAVRELISRMSAENSAVPCHIIITGGAGELLARELSPAVSCPNLTIQGLAITAGILLQNPVG